MIIPHSKPFLGTSEAEAVRTVVLSGQISQGAEVQGLEKDLSAMVGQEYGVAVSSGTAALYLALRSLGVKRGHSVVIPSYVCTALLNAVFMTGATPSISDVDPDIGEMTVATAQKALRKNTKAVIVPHLFGVPADAAAIQEACGIPVIEDCAQCVGTSLNAKKAGGQTLLSVFSFYATKLLSAGEGGMVATSRKSIADAVVAMREYDNRKSYVPGFNFKLSDLHAVIARRQLKKLPAMVRMRRNIAGLYDTAIAKQPLLANQDIANALKHSVYFRYVIKTTGDADTVITKMDKRGIACRKPIFKPLHLYLKRNGFPGTNAMYKSAISIPIYPGLSTQQIECICKAIGSKNLFV